MEILIQQCQTLGLGARQRVASSDDPAEGQVVQSLGGGITTVVGGLGLDGHESSTQHETLTDLVVTNDLLAARDGDQGGEAELRGILRNAELRACTRQSGSIRNLRRLVTLRSISVVCARGRQSKP